MKNHRQKNNESLSKDPGPIRIITTVMAVALAIAGLHHGFFEILQGNNPTTGLIIQSIGKEFQYWDNGDEAFTFIPNFLFTGIAAVCVGLVIIFWAVCRVHKKHGPLGLLLLFVLLTSVGGGIGHIAFFLPLWGYSTRMHKPLRWWKEILGQGFGKLLSKIWVPTLIIASGSFIIALEISVFGIPGIRDDETIMGYCNLFLLSGFVFENITFISGFARTIHAGTS